METKQKYKFDIVDELKATEQYENEVQGYYDYLRNFPEMQECAEAILHLRHKMKNQHFDIVNVLYNDKCKNESSTYLCNFGTVMDNDEHMLLPRAMTSLLSDLHHSILDDGFICLYEVCVMEDIRGLFKDERKGPPKTLQNKTVFYYFLSTDDNSLSDKEKYGKEWLSWNEYRFINPIFESARCEYFGTVGKFVELLRILGDKKSYDKNDYLKEEAIKPYFDALAKEHGHATWRV